MTWRKEFIKSKGNTTRWWLVYSEYLNSKEWAARRVRALEHDSHQCRVCGYGHELQVHHVRYDNIGAEKAADLTTLCKDCHRFVTGLIRAGRVKSGDRIYDNLIAPMPKLLSREPLDRLMESMARLTKEVITPRLILKGKFPLFWLFCW